MMNINQSFQWLHIGLPDDILRLKQFGDTAAAVALIDQRLSAQSLPAALRSSLLVQREIITRLPENYPFTKEDALARVRGRIPAFTEMEFDEMVADGRIDWIYLRGIPHYFDRFYESLVKTDAAFARRADEKNTPPADGSTVAANGDEDILTRTIHCMKENGALTHRIRVRATIRVKDDRFTAGAFYRIHLPIPCACPQQSDIRIDLLDPPNGQLAPEDAPQRTVCWEGHMEENRTYTVEYSYLHTARYCDPSDILPDAEQPTFDTHEQAPHILFTPYIRALVHELSDGLDSPLDKARAFYDYITLNVKYSFVRSYFTIESIPETCARNLRGDCGMMALLFITMCRCAGIPARWQSGLNTRPDFCGAHDWAKFYIAPYGWLYADPSFGTGAVREGNEERRRFYFGNLDGYRMVANTQFQAPFTIAKEHWRVDPYDNQVGEVECATHGLRSADYSCTKQVLECTQIP